MASVLHRIKAYLYKNYLNPKAGEYIARVVSERTLNTSEVCKAAVTRGGADIAPEALEYYVNLFLKEMTYSLCDGYAVNTGYFNAGTQLRGVFNSPQEHFDPKKNTPSCFNFSRES